MQSLPAGGHTRCCEVLHPPNTTKSTVEASHFASFSWPQINNFSHVFTPARPSLQGILQNFYLLVRARFWKTISPTWPTLEIGRLLPSWPCLPRSPCCRCWEIWVRESSARTHRVVRHTCRWTCDRSLNSSSHQVCVFSSEQAHTISFPIGKVLTTSCFSTLSLTFPCISNCQVT